MHKMKLVNSLARLSVLAIVSVLLSACVTAPLDHPRQESVALTDEQASDTRQASNALKWVGGREDANGFYPFTEGFDAFGARLKLMDNAEKSLDIQYFLMKPDNAGLVFAAEMLRAADRGVRVRLLLDDIFTTVEVDDLAILDTHPNIEVRLFNPIARKGIALLNYLGHFSLTNRRMHNKSFVADNRMAVVGGRNIAVEYFQLETSGEFVDFDMFAVGPVVREVSTQFDRYWNHQLAVPLTAFYNEDDKEKIQASRILLDQEMAKAGQSIYAEAVKTPVLKKFAAGEASPFIAPARLVTDDPDKLLQEISDEHKIVASEIRQALLDAESEIILITPYFIPRKGGIELLRKINDKGVRVTVLTNSLATNNHTPVHSAYASYRRRLLDAGVELWEARVDAAKIILPDGESQLDKLTLHTKGILIDRNRVFVGSLNLDPRSIDINTEMGLLVDSAKMVEWMTDEVRESIPKVAYRIKMDEDRNLRWHAMIDGEEVIETVEPQTTAWRRFMAWVMKIVPESQL
jgi:putative cardiolipin synthase